MWNQYHWICTIETRFSVLDFASDNLHIVGLSKLNLGKRITYVPYISGLRIEGYL
jgi:hypothetical protein